MNDKALVPLEPRDLTELKGVAQLFAASGLFADAKDMAQAFVKIMAGREAGFGAFASMQNVHIISGKPVLSAHMMAAAVKRNPKYDYQIVELTDSVCVLEFYQDGKVAGTVRQTIEDARKAKVTSNQTWEKYPRNMLFARAISNGVRWYCPDAFDMPVYTPDELGAEDDSQVPYDNETGEVIEGAFTEDEPEPEPPASEPAAETPPPAESEPEPAHTDELPPAAQDDGADWRTSTAPLTQATWAKFQPWLQSAYGMKAIAHVGNAVMQALREAGKVPPGDKPDWGAVFGKVTPGEVLDALDAHYAKEAKAA
jgi:hypothetical protein